MITNDKGVLVQPKAAISSFIMPALQQEPGRLPIEPSVGITLMDLQIILDEASQQIVNQFRIEMEQFFKEKREETYESLAPILQKPVKDDDCLENENEGTHDIIQMQFGEMEFVWKNEKLYEIWMSTSQKLIDCLEKQEDEIIENVNEIQDTVVNIGENMEIMQNNIAKMFQYNEIDLVVKEIEMIRAPDLECFSMIIKIKIERVYKRRLKRIKD